MSLRPDLIECWVFRVPPPAAPLDRGPTADRLEILLIRRAPTGSSPGSGSASPAGSSPVSACPPPPCARSARRPASGAAEIEAWYDLDQVAPFYDEGSDAVVVSAIFAARVRADAVPRASWEHDGLRWVPADDAPALAVWPSYAESVRRVREQLLDPALARWFLLDGEGRRVARRPLA